MLFSPSALGLAVIELFFFFCSNLYSAVLWICDQNSSDNILIF